MSAQILLRPKSRAGRPSRLSPMDEIDLLAWWHAKQALGTFKEKARDIGMTRSALRAHIDRLLAREIK